MEAAKKLCLRPGCRIKYTEEENNDTACYYHDGNPIFHDIKKGWTCCNIIKYDFDEFMKIKGCKVGSHSDVKPQTSNNQFYKSNTVSNAEKGINKFDNNDKNKQGDIVKPTEQGKPVKDIKEFEEELRKAEEEKKKKEAQKPKEILKNKEGKYYCGNAGCSTKLYDPENNIEGDCKHHLGQPVFHDRKKYWNCCKQEAYDWDDFMKLPECVVGKHSPKYK